jgi:HlyD family secretion protein
MKKINIILSACYMLAVMLTGCSENSAKSSEAEAVAAPIAVNKVVAIGRIEPEQKIAALSSEVNGIVQKVNVQAGEQVKKGAPIVEISQDLEKARLGLAKSRIITQQKEITVLQAQLASAKLRASNLKTSLQRTRNLFEKGSETSQNLDNAQTEYDAALQEISRLEASISAARSRINEINADIHVATVELSKRSINAPADGIVLTMDLTPGMMISAGSIVADFAPEGDLTAFCEVDELFANKVALGQKAVIRAQGEQDTLASGEVVFVSPSLKKKSIFSDDVANMEDRRVREVRIRLAQGKELLYNARVECVISLK